MGKLILWLVWSCMFLLFGFFLVGHTYYLWINGYNKIYALSCILIAILVFIGFYHIQINYVFKVKDKK